VKAMHAPAPWQAAHFTRHDGAPIETVEDVAETVAQSARASDGLTLYGVTAGSPDRDGAVKVVCFTGNGPMSAAHAALIAAAPELLAALEGLSLECLADALNPCLSGWAVGKPVQHWGSDPGHVVPACSSCVARAAIAKAKGGAA